MDILQGIRVIDLSFFLAGPHATAMLADLGAEVISVEQPGIGDPARGYQRFFGVPLMLPGGRNVETEYSLRNKKSITLDVRKDAGREMLYRLVSKSDVFVTNFRPQVCSRLRVDYQSLREINPRLVYGWVTCFGPRGPMADKGGLEPVVQARSGVMAASGEEGMPPIIVSPGIADQMAATVLAYGLVSALLGRERLGVGQQVIVSQFGSLVYLQATSVIANLLTGKSLSRHTRSKAANPLWNHYQCKDGKWIMFGCAQGDRYWPEFCRTIAMPELEHDARFADMDLREANREALIRILDELFRMKTQREWEIILKETDLLYSPVQDIAEVIGDPQAMENGYFTEVDHPDLGHIKFTGSPVEFSETPAVSFRSPAPEVGQHTEEVLLELGGCDWDQIVELKDAGVI